MRKGKRFRKKYHLGEFKELGFNLSFSFSQELSDRDRNDLLNKFIKEAIESNGLVFGGGGSENSWEGFVTLDKSRGSVSNEQRETVIEWLAKNTLIEKYEASILSDAWR